MTGLHFCPKFHFFGKISIFHTKLLKIRKIPQNENYIQFYIQLFNPLDVDVIWKYEKPFDKRNIIDKHLPLHLRRKIRKSQKPLPMVFDIVPNDGILRPKERRNVEIKFMPNSDEYFHEKMVLTILESIQKVIIEVGV